MNDTSSFQSPESRALIELISVLSDGRIDADSRQGIKRAASHLVKSVEQRPFIVCLGIWKMLVGLVAFIASVVSIR